jgi:hypothetical protein
MRPIQRHLGAEVMHAKQTTSAVLPAQLTVMALVEANVIWDRMNWTLPCRL